MKRINIYESNEYGDRIFIGWFNMDSATCLAKHQRGDAYTEYTWVYLTAGGKLIVERSNNSGMREHYSPISAKEVVMLINESGTSEGHEWAEGKGSEEFAKAEIK